MASTSTASAGSIPTAAASHSPLPGPSPRPLGRLRRPKATLTQQQVYAQAFESLTGWMYCPAYYDVVRRQHAQWGNSDEYEDEFYQFALDLAERGALTPHEAVQRLKWRRKTG